MYGNIEGTGTGATLELTDRSNYADRLLRCRDTDRMLSEKAWKTVIRDLVCNRGISRIRFADGEPMLHPGTAELVRYAKELGAETSLCTNGSLICREFLTEMAEHLDELELTVCSSQENVEMSMGRHAPGVNHLNRTAELSLCAEENGIRVLLSIAVTRKCLKDGFSDLLKGMHTDRVRIVRMDSDTGLADLKRYRVSDKEFEAFLERNFDIGAEVRLPFTDMVMTPDGRVEMTSEETFTVSYKRYWNEGSDLGDLKTDILQSGFYRNTVRPAVDRFRAFSPRYSSTAPAFWLADWDCCCPHCFEAESG